MLRFLGKNQTVDIHVPLGNATLHPRHALPMPCPLKKCYWITQISCSSLAEMLPPTLTSVLLHLALFKRYCSCFKEVQWSSSSPSLFDITHMPTFIHDKIWSPSALCLPSTRQPPDQEGLGNLQTRRVYITLLVDHLPGRGSLAFPLTVHRNSAWCLPLRFAG